MRRLNLRGRYEGGGYVVTARHWWSRKDRADARTAAKILAYDAANFQQGLRQSTIDAMIHGAAHVVVKWEGGER